MVQPYSPFYTWQSRDTTSLITVPNSFAACPADSHSVPLDSSDSTSATPDLVISRIVLNPVNNQDVQIIPGTALNAVPIRITVRNLKPVPAIISSQGLGFDLNFPVQGWTFPVSTYNVSQIPACGSVIFTTGTNLRFIEPAVPLTIGAYPVKAKVNPAPSISETNYNNNTTTGYFTVQ